jgi:uncharacterized membrane protein
MVPHIEFSSWWWRVYAVLIWAAFISSLLDPSYSLSRVDDALASVYVVLSVWFLVPLTFVTERLFNLKVIPVRFWRVIFFVEIITAPLQLYYTRVIAVALIEEPVGRIPMFIGDGALGLFFGIYLYALYYYVFVQNRTTHA